MATVPCRGAGVAVPQPDVSIDIQYTASLDSGMVMEETHSTSSKSPSSKRATICLPHHTGAATVPCRAAAVSHHDIAIDLHCSDSLDGAVDVADICTASRKNSGSSSKTTQIQLANRTVIPGSSSSHSSPLSPDCFVEMMPLHRVQSLPVPRSVDRVPADTFRSLPATFRSAPTLTRPWTLSMRVPWPALSRISSGCQETFMCTICQCHEARSLAFTVPECEHQFCVPCLDGYLTSQIVDGKTNLRCPHVSDEQPRCPVMFTVEQVEMLVNAEVFAKFERFSSLQKNPNMRACPACNQLQTRAPNCPLLTCTSCGVQFCFLHGDAHSLSETCEAFELRTRGRDAVTLKFVEKTSRTCPKCHVPTFKYTGCNHMKCSQCGEDWCWLCGQIIDVSGAYPRHFDQRNLFSRCAGRQFDEANAADIMCCCHRLAPCYHQITLHCPFRCDWPTFEEHNECGKILILVLYYSPLSLIFWPIAFILHIAIIVVLFPICCCVPGLQWHIRKCSVRNLVVFQWVLLAMPLWLPLLALLCIVGPIISCFSFLAHVITDKDCFLCIAKVCCPCYYPFYEWDSD